MKKTDAYVRKKSQIVNKFKFIYRNRKSFRDGKTGSRPTAAAVSYCIGHRYIIFIHLVK